MMSPLTRSRQLALVGALFGERQLTQTEGFPLDPAKMLPLADVVLLVADTEPGAMLFRYTAHGEAAGDTWHPSLAIARAQAEEEYGSALGEWVDVPDEITDAHVFAVQYAYERLNGRGDW
jgi:hypothetical protein